MIKTVRTGGRVALVFSLFLSLPLLLTGCSQESLAGEEELAIGKPAPEIIGANVDGEEMRLSDFLGKVVVIDFWGDW